MEWEVENEGLKEGGLVKRGNSELLCAVQYRMTSKAGLWVKELGEGGGGVVRRAC